jgi:polysaccharide export outer membrane protein
MKISQWKRCRLAGLLVVVVSLMFAGCATRSLPPLPTSKGTLPSTADPASYNYLIGPGDSVNIFVWRNGEVSTTVTVRPDGKITTPLVEDLPASGKTPSQLARDIEKALSTYIKEPIVTVIVGGFIGPYSEQIRVVGEAARPQALPYRQKMTLLDLMITVGGITDFAAGNRASVVRFVDGKQKQFSVRIEDLIKDGDISANVDMLPGDILIIPESWF